MRVYVYPADLWACGHYRMIYPAEVAAASEPDLDVTVVEPGRQTGLAAFTDGRGKVTGASAPDGADVVVFQRPSFPAMVAAIPFLRAKGIAVVVDLDDDLAHIDPRNPAFALMHPSPRFELEPPEVREQVFAVATRCGRSPHIVYAHYLSKRKPHSWAKIKDASRDATLVTVSTPALAQRYGRNTIVVRNYIPERYLTIERVDSDEIGWAGAIHSHPGDLRAMQGAIGRLVREGARFRVVGNAAGAERDLGVDSINQTDPVPFHDWPQAVASIGIGVAPLADTKFNAAKSWLKPLEYSACGVPWVASPRAEYRAIHALGTGALAERNREWVRELRYLVSDDAYRAERSAAARDVAAGLTIEAHAWRTVDAWKEALDRERGGKRQTASA